jgi:hypothetical protein
MYDWRWDIWIERLSLFGFIFKTNKRLFYSKFILFVVLYFRYSTPPPYWFVEVVSLEIQNLPVQRVSKAVAISKLLI